MSPEQLDGQPATPASDVHGLGRVFEYVLRAGAAAEWPPATVDSLEAIEREIRRATSPDPRDRPRDAAEFVRLLRTVIGNERPITGDGSLANPYKGLRAFEEADASDFFGRERVVERLVTRLGDTGSRGRFIVVVGSAVSRAW
jgi:hypothetical protein